MFIIESFIVWNISIIIIEKDIWYSILNEINYVFFVWLYNFVKLKNCGYLLYMNLFGLNCLRRKKIMKILKILVMGNVL